MQLNLATVVALFGASAIAATVPRAYSEDPPPVETIFIRNFLVHTLPNGVIIDVKFNLSGRDVAYLHCDGAYPEASKKPFTCGLGSKYSFKLEKGVKTAFALRIYHELGPGAGYSGLGDVPTTCKASPFREQFCIQDDATATITIHNSSAPINP